MQALIKGGFVMLNNSLHFYAIITTVWLIIEKYQVGPILTCMCVVVTFCRTVV